MVTFWTTICRRSMLPKRTMFQTSRWELFSYTCRVVYVIEASWVFTFPNEICTTGLYRIVPSSSHRQTDSWKYGFDCDSVRPSFLLVQALCQAESIKLPELSWHLLIVQKGIVSIHIGPFHSPGFMPCLKSQLWQLSLGVCLDLSCVCQPFPKYRGL